MVDLILGKCELVNTICAIISPLLLYTIDLSFFLLITGTYPVFCLTTQNETIVLHNLYDIRNVLSQIVAQIKAIV